MLSLWWRNVSAHSLAIKCVTSFPMFAQLEGSNRNNWIPISAISHSIRYTQYTIFAARPSPSCLWKRLRALMVITSLVRFYGLFTLTCILKDIPLRWDPRTSINDRLLPLPAHVLLFFLFSQPSFNISTPVIRNPVVIMMRLMIPPIVRWCVRWCVATHCSRLNGIYYYIWWRPFSRSTR